MAIELELKYSAKGANDGIKETREALQGTAEGFEKLEDAAKDAVNGIKKSNTGMAKSSQETGKALGKQVKAVDLLRDHLKRLEKGQQKAADAQDPKKVLKYNKAIAETRAAINGMAKATTKGKQGLNSLNNRAIASRKIFAGLKTTIATTFAPLLAVGAAVGGVRAVISEVTEYNQVAKDLQAITGANAETLDFLKQKAVETGFETTIGAVKTLEAYKLIASAKPELLDNAEGLAFITRNAVTLAEAMGGDLPTAATNLTDIMNQFNEPAEQSGRVINAIAAGSKAGSAEIDQIAASILVAGTEAKASNVSLEESVGLVEALAEKGKKGAEAGTGLRNIFSKLSATDILPKDAVDRLDAAGVNINTLSDKSLTFAQRLEALKPIQNDSNALTALFGLENKSTAQILIGNIDRVKELTTAVTGSNVATEQAAIKTASARAQYQRLKTTISSLVLTQGNGLESVLAGTLSFLREGVVALNSVITDLRPAFSAVYDSVSQLFNVVSSLLPAQDAAADGASKWGAVLRVAAKPLNLFLKSLALGIGLISDFIEVSAKVIQNNKNLSAGFSTLKNFVTGVADVFFNLPSYVAGGAASISTFLSTSLSNIKDFASNTGTLLIEAFNFKKLFTEGRAGLDQALNNLVNPFKGVGKKSAEAFNAAFEKTQKALNVTATVTETKNTVNTVTTSNTGSSPVNVPQTTKSVDRAQEQRDKDAKKAASELAKARIAALKDGAEKQLAIEELRYKDLKERLEKFNLDTSQATEQHELNKLNIKRKFLVQEADLQGIAGEERINYLYDQTLKEITALESALKQSNGGNLLASQTAQINLMRKAAAESYAQQLKSFQSKEQKEAEDHEILLLELKRDSFNTQAEFEDFKGKEILNIRLKYAEKQLEILEKLEGADSNAALSLRKTINTLKSELSSLTNGNTATDFSLYDLIGLDPNDPSNGNLIKGIEAAASTAISTYTDINNTRLAAAQQNIDISNQEIKAIDDQIAAKEKELEDIDDIESKGYANNRDRIEKEIELLREQQEKEKIERDKALSQKKRIQREQAIVDTITQGTSLITAAAQIFNSVAAIPFAGPAIGAGLVAAMVGSFIAAKAQVFSNISKIKAKKGITGIVRGKSHEAGGERFTDHIEVEGKEGYGVLSKPATKKYFGRFSALTKAFNSNDEKGIDKVARTLLINKNSLKRRDASLRVEENQNKIILLQERSNSDELNEMRKSNEYLRGLLIAKENEKNIVVQGDKIIITEGANTTIITKK